MKVVDFFGPSGVGKSTTYRELCKMGGIIPALALDYSRSKAILAQAVERDGNLAAFKRLIDRVFETATGPRIGTRRNHTYRSLRMTVQNKLDPQSGVVVIDGGLLQRGQAVDRLQSKVPLEEYYWTMPAPDMAVMFAADADTIKARNVKRGGDHDRSADVERSLYVHGVARDILKGRGIPTVVVDTNEPPSFNAALIHSFVGML